MDILSHLLLGLNITNFVERPEEKLTVMVASILPDIGEIFIQKVLNKKYGAKFGVYDERTSDLSVANNIKVTWIYDILHSPIFYLILFLFSKLSQIDLISVFAIAGLFHISLDFSTHGKVWALKLFYPISNKRFPILNKQLGNWWDWMPTINLGGIQLPKICLLIWLILTILFFNFK